MNQEDFSTRSSSLLNTAGRLSRSLNALLANVTDDAVRQRIKDYADNCDTIARALSPFTVGLCGMTGAGKTRLINKLVGVKLPESRGRGTTAVITEIVSRPKMANFKATVYFHSVETISEYLQYAVATGGSSSTDCRLQAIREVLTKLFSGGLSTAVSLTPRTTEDNNDPLVSFIGAAPRELEGRTLKSLLRQLEPFICLPQKFKRDDPGPDEDPDEVAAAAADEPPLTHLDPWMSIVVSKVVIEGYFEHLPEGVTLVDTPGLCDRFRLNSQRTIDMYAQLDRTWYAVTFNRAFNRADEASSFSPMVATPEQIDRLSVIATQFAVEEDERYIPQIRDQIREDMTDCAFPFEEDAIAAENALRLTNCNMLNTVPIHFTQLGGDQEFGIDALRGCLREYGDQVLATLEEMELDMRGVLEGINTCGQGQGVRVPLPDHIRDELDLWAQNSCEISRQIRYHHREKFTVDDKATRRYARLCRDGVWDAIHHKTWMAALDNWRQGIFHGKGAARPHLDVNSDIAAVWVSSSRHLVADAHTRVRQASQDLSDIVATWDEAPESFRDDIRSEVRALRLRYRELETMAFGQPLQEFIRERLSRSCYGRGSTRKPSERCIKSLFKDLYQYLKELLCSLERAFERVVRRIIRHMTVLNIPQDLRTILQDIAATAEAFAANSPTSDPPVYLCCPISLELFEDPVVVSDGHIFDRASIENYFNSLQPRTHPVCCLDRVQISRVLVPSAFMRSQVELWRDQHRSANEAPIDWWVGLLESIRENVENAQRDREEELVEETEEVRLALGAFNL
mmetsp:Transcript_36769/g.80058  ORF Transcript_36769/g.80058 Transcript_36769/m.80058 type:complete len:797 (-) Transcript_36769:158-2548(-)